MASSFEKSRGFMNTPKRPPEAPKELRRDVIEPSKNCRDFFAKPQRPPQVEKKFTVEPVSGDLNNLQEPRSHKERQISELSSEELITKFRDPAYLPTTADIREAFKGKHRRQEWDELTSTKFNLEGGYYIPQKEVHPIYEFFNEEYVRALAAYLQRRIEKLGGTREKPVVILEVGAGGGRLTHFLQEKLRSLEPGTFQIVATDLGEDIVHDFPVEAMDQKEAIQRYKPQIIISSWMPYEEDWTTDFRAAPSVEEYIIIGNPECVGDRLKTWGDNWRWNEEQTVFLNDDKKAPYKIDGFIKVDKNNMSKLQICRSDLKGGIVSSNDANHSRTVCFIRKEAPDKKARQRTPRW